jgi:O-methyltransferase
MYRVVRRIANSMLAVFGARLCRLDEGALCTQEYKSLLDKHKTLLDEINACFIELCFPGLPPHDHRIDLLTNLIGTPVCEALYIVAYLHKSLDLSGDVCEFGVAQGATSALLANEVCATDKRLWLFDSFKGLGKPSEKDVLIDDIFSLGSIDKYEGTMAYRVEEVKSRLKDISFPESRTKIVDGFIEETINRAELPDNVCFAYIDFDFYNPISVALQFLNDHLSPGGFVIVDDYGFFSAGAKGAVDEFLMEHRGEYEIAFPYKFASRTTPFCILHKTHA